MARVTTGTCEACFFWDNKPQTHLKFGAVSTPKSGLCRRHAPFQTGNFSGRFHSWLETWPDDWCGEFAPR